MKIRCPNSECPGAAGAELPAFDVVVTVSAELELTEDIPDIDPDAFRCIHCATDAEEDPE